MDKKYIINANENNIINWIGINTEKGLKIIDITDSDNPTKYMNQLRSIDREYGDFFYNFVRHNFVLLKSNYISIGQEEKQQEIEIKEEKQENKIVEEENKIENSRLKRRIDSKSIRRIAAIALAGIIGTSVISLAKEGSIVAKAKSILGLNKQTTKQVSDESKEKKEESLENKSLDELISMLNKDGQQQAFNKIIDTQDYFNEVAAPTVKQGDKQLYVTFDETTSAYLYANAKAVSSDKLSSFFGKSKILLLNNNGEYEQLDNEGVAANYLSFCLNLSYYYQLGATDTSGVSQIFENEEEAKFFNEFEAKILEYNKNKNENTKDEIRQMLENIYMSGNVDSVMDKYSGASSIIGTAIVPYLYLEGIIDEEMYNSLVEINETLTCQDIYSQIGKIVNCKVKENGKEAIIEEIVRRQNQTIKGLDRNLDLSEIYGLSDLETYVIGYASGYSNSRTITKHVKTATKDRSKAVEMTSEKDVRRAEDEADKEIEKKNAAENARAEQLIKENEKQDEKDKQKQKQEYDEQHKNDKPKEVITEETWVPEETPQNHDDRDDTETEPRVVEEVIEDTHIYGEEPKAEASSNSNSNSSSDSSQPRVVEEVIEDDHIYGEAPKAQKVVQIERYEETNEAVETAEETTEETPEEANVRVRQ